MKMRAFWCMISLFVTLTFQTPIVPSTSIFQDNEANALANSDVSHGLAITNTTTNGPFPTRRILRVHPRSRYQTFDASALDALTLEASAEVKSSIIQDGEDAKAQTMSVTKDGLVFYVEKVRFSGRPFTNGLLKDFITLLREYWPLGTAFKIAESELMLYDVEPDRSLVLVAKGYVHVKYDTS